MDCEKCEILNHVKEILKNTINLNRGLPQSPCNGGNENIIFTSTLDFRKGKWHLANVLLKFIEEAEKLTE